MNALRLVTSHDRRPVVVDDLTGRIYTRTSEGTVLAVSRFGGGYAIPDPHEPATVIAEVMLLVASEVAA